MPSMSVVVRPFRRFDRDQLTDLVNAHAGAVVPGASVSANTVLNQLEREPGEFIVDPWVTERMTLLAEQRERIVAAAHLLRYAGDERVGVQFRDSGEIRWFLFWPEAPYWPDSASAARALMGECLKQLDRWSVAIQTADGALPVPGVYGVPEQWPHIAELYEAAAFAHGGRVEIVFMARVDELARCDTPPLQAPRLLRSVGINGTRLSAYLGDERVGYIEVASREEPGRPPQHGGLADIGNLHIGEQWQRQGIGRWLVAQAADWLRLGRFDRVLDYALADDVAYQAFLKNVGFRELTRTRRGWRRTPGSMAAQREA